MDKNEILSLLTEIRAYVYLTWEHWDKDEDHKVGKRLRALAGDMSGYHPTADKLDAAIKKLEQA